MPLPTNPLVIWAEDNINLPNTGQPNKAAPQESLRKVGWDEGQEPSCEEFNYILNNLAQYIQYYGIEKTQDFLVKANNLSDLTNIDTARNNLSVYSREQIDTSTTNIYTSISNLTNNVNAKRIDTGTGLTGGGDLSASRTLSLSSVTSCVSILTGTVASGGIIPLPSGYTEAQCKWMVSINTDNTANQGWDIAEVGSISTPYRLTCDASTRTVTIKATVFADTGQGGTGSYQDRLGTANYIIIGVK